MGPSRAQRGLVALAAAAVGVATVSIAAGSAYVAYSCLVPEPTLDVRFTEMPSASRLTELTDSDGARSRELTADATYRIRFDRGAGDERDALARRLRAHDEVVAVETGGERCD